MDVSTKLRKPFLAKFENVHTESKRAMSKRTWLFCADKNSNKMASPGRFELPALLFYAGFVNICPQKTGHATGKRWKRQKDVYPLFSIEGKSDIVVVG